MSELTSAESREIQAMRVRNLFISIDPYMRGRLNDGELRALPVEMVKPLPVDALGEDFIV